MKYTVRTVLANTWLKQMYRDQPKELQKQIDARIESLLHETGEYQTAVNLVNLSCILSGIAMYQVLGLSKEAYAETVHAYLLPVIEQKKRQMHMIGKLPGAYAILSRMVPRMMTMGNQCGWHTEKIPANDRVFGFDTTKCIYNTLCRKYDVIELGREFCLTDDLIYGDIPHIRMERKGTLCRDQDHCDFRFYHEK